MQGIILGMHGKGAKHLPEISMTSASTMPDQLLPAVQGLFVSDAL